WTAAAVDGSLQPVATERVPVSRDGYRALRRFAHLWPHARWAIEGAAGPGEAGRSGARAVERARPQKRRRRRAVVRDRGADVPRAAHCRDRCCYHGLALSSSTAMTW